MSNGKWLRAAKAKRAELDKQAAVLEEIRARAEALGNTPTLARLAAFLQAIRESLGRA